MVAPGMAEIIHVDFVATEWRYHYDAIRVFSDGDAPLLVPMHAYPVMNEVALPSKLDFGHCPLGEPTTRSLELACHVPIQFEYSVQVDKPHPHFELVSAPRDGPSDPSPSLGSGDLLRWDRETPERE